MSNIRIHCTFDARTMIQPTALVMLMSPVLAAIINAYIRLQSNESSLIVGGFCREVFQALPMEFAVEAQKLIALSLEGSVG